MLVRFFVRYEWILCSLMRFRLETGCGGLEGVLCEEWGGCCDDFVIVLGLGVGVM